MVERAWMEVTSSTINKPHMHYGPLSFHPLAHDDYSVPWCVTVIYAGGLVWIAGKCNWYIAIMKSHQPGGWRKGYTIAKKNQCKMTGMGTEMNRQESKKTKTNINSLRKSIKWSTRTNCSKVKRSALSWPEPKTSWHAAEGVSALPKTACAATMVTPGREKMARSFGGGSFMEVMHSKD